MVLVEEGVGGDCTVCRILALDGKVVPTGLVTFMRADMGEDGVG